MRSKSTICVLQQEESCYNMVLSHIPALVEVYEGVITGIIETPRENGDRIIKEHAHHTCYPYLNNLTNHCQLCIKPITPYVYAVACELSLDQYSFTKSFVFQSQFAFGGRSAHV